MLRRRAGQIGGYADVQRAALAAGEDVDAGHLRSGRRPYEALDPGFRRRRRSVACSSLPIAFVANPTARHPGESRNPRAFARNRWSPCAQRQSLDPDHRPSVAMPAMRTPASVRLVDRALVGRQRRFVQRFAQRRVRVADAREVLGRAGNSIATTASAISSRRDRRRTMCTPRMRRSPRRDQLHEAGGLVHRHRAAVRRERERAGLVRAALGLDLGSRSCRPRRSPGAV